MLKTEQTGKGPGPKLAGHDYTLENLKRYGGVCAQQADFVARVGKSLGQPTVYVSGESSYRGWHAWVMWVNVIKSGKEKIRFELVSDGRTRGFERDAFYTGWIYDPQTGQRILDRDMERRLVTVALDPHARRQASLAMRAYPAIAQSLTLGAKERVAFLDRIWQLCPQSEEAWLELARLAKQGELKDALRGTTAARLATATKTFAKNPDFIARLSDDLLAAEPSVPQKIKHYERILVLFEKAARPDLCCETRLKISDYWSEQKRYKEAAQTLTQAVRKFPTEGRYIPRLLAACEKVCENYSAGVTPLANLYIELGPALVLHYKGEPNPFLDQVLAQGKAFFAAKNLTKQASTFNTRVAQAKARSGKS
jgi:tetratricopeptide (TPR) repeat protein